MVLLKSLIFRNELILRGKTADSEVIKIILNIEDQKKNDGKYILNAICDFVVTL